MEEPVSSCREPAGAAGADGQGARGRSEVRGTAAGRHGGTGWLACRRCRGGASLVEEVGLEGGRQW